ncbi:MAG TPA: hypothetical protein VGX16_07585, partial [Solirubrobacteraceae bacterium]|nr:hypothetical protein [Solirubrobacteraceae bacterium]
TLGEALLMLAMMVAGLWVIADPGGTVGVLEHWANRASVGTLGAVSAGTPDHPDRTLAQGMQDVFASVVGAPWCYMEFGAVRWCRDPGLLDPALRRAALGIAAREPGLRAELLRGARTNGEIFLALPANGPGRNSISDSGSLLRALCGAEEMGECAGPMAARAEFRTGRGVWSRLVGLALIVAGALGAVLLLGFLALNLLGAAILSLFYLLLTPAAVLAPALGDGGRAAFRAWGTHLLGAVVSKLLYSFLLGVALMMMRIMLSLQGLGWWAQWLLISALWWMAYRRRRQLLGLVRGEGRSAGGARSIGSRVRDALQIPRDAMRVGGWVRDKLKRPAPSVERRDGLTEAAGTKAQERSGEQVERTLDRDLGEAKEKIAGKSETLGRIAELRAQLDRVRTARAEAKASGDARGEAKLAARAERIEGEIAREQGPLNEARERVSASKKQKRLTGSPHSRIERKERAKFLDEQAALPGSLERAERRRRGEEPLPNRDYAALAGLAGLGRAEYEGLDPAGRRRARLEIDRELALRRELAGTVAEIADGAREQPGPRERERVEEEFDGVLKKRIGDGGHVPPRRPKTPRPPTGRWSPESGPGGPLTTWPTRHGRESAVMRDAKDVAEGRKRQLGWRTGE